MRAEKLEIPTLIDTMALCFHVTKNRAKYVILSASEFRLDIYAIICLKYPLMKFKIKSCRKLLLTEKYLSFFSKFSEEI